MKKFFVLLVALIGFGFFANAQDYCTVKGANGTVQGVVSYNAQTGKANVTLNNSSGKMANVTFELTATDMYGKTQTVGYWTGLALSGRNNPISLDVQQVLTRNPKRTSTGQVDGPIEIWAYPTSVTLKMKGADCAE